ncbi:hypothetical protein FOMG_16411 [Fusarium oxysporum f. sp. melonis 26406]|uniref:Uncharacterized protein n=1 Tax=Fusarium oxysporum f. sp. melonis 26406 TaxID=1089452 RepID=X0A102_FUSOX|nr:hypothetical protein FOMG_16411 [Fusarium oxysporum f. sp. melonis 26406]
MISGLGRRFAYIFQELAEFLRLNYLTDLVALQLLGGPRDQVNTDLLVGPQSTLMMNAEDVLGLDPSRIITGRVNPDTTDWMGSTALFAAVANGHMHVARLLIASGAAVEMQAGVGRSLIWWALRAGNPELLQLLVEHAETVGTRDLG